MCVSVCVCECVCVCVFVCVCRAGLISLGAILQHIATLPISVGVRFKA